MHTSKVLQNQKALQEKEESEDLLEVQLKQKQLLIKIVMLKIAILVFKNSAFSTGELKSFHVT